MSETDTDLPKTLIKRIVKRHLSQIDKGDTKRDTQINKDALLAFSESAKVFINYVTATANDICKESKRQTISVDDIFRALEDTDFVDLIAPLKQSLEGMVTWYLCSKHCPFCHKTCGLCKHSVMSEWEQAVICVHGMKLVWSLWRCALFPCSFQEGHQREKSEES